MWESLIMKFITTLLKFNKNIKSINIPKRNFRKFPDCYRWKNEAGGQDHTSESLLQQSVTWHRDVNTHCFYTSSFSTSCFVLSAMDGKIEQLVCIHFCVKLRRSATETLEMLRETFGERSLRRTEVFEWHWCFKAGRVSVEDDKSSGRQSTAKQQKISKIF
jgi:hypothetical protein